MHYHMEIIMPPVDNIEEAVATILKPYSENLDPKDEDASSFRFWDWYVIGGRWAGVKLNAVLGDERIQAFREKLVEQGITVSGLIAGKETLQPKSQIPVVDAMWNEAFPDSAVKVCPLFDHFNDKYKNSAGYPDVMPLKDVPRDLTMESVIIAGPNIGSGKLEAVSFLKDSIWNGVCHQKTAFKGTLEDALIFHAEDTKTYREEYRDKVTPDDTWLVVTVDYHC